MLQIVYVSTPAPGQPVEPEAILARARANNMRDGITGMLYADGTRYMQVMEGAADVIERTMARIRSDGRHRAIVVLSKREITQREFGDWSMAHLSPGGGAAEFLAKVQAMVANASPSVRATFEGMAALRKVA